MNNKKEREREELHKTIWKIANELRGSVDGWDFKQYVLGLLFYRFISENIENYVNENQRKAGIIDFQYRNISDEEALLGKSQILDEKGLFILPSELFCNTRKGADKNENLNVVISNVFNNIEASARGSESEDDVKGLFDDFTIDNKLGNTVDERNEKLVKLLNAIGDLNFGDYEDNNIDLFGDAYEFLMTMYASNAGKSGGEFFTPQEVGELLARIVIMDKKSVNKVYDPACGSGGLLLKFAKILGKENVREGFFGQEINLTTYNLARINMFLHNINYNNFSIERGDTLLHPAHWNDEPFDAIVSNPPYSTKWVGNSNPLLINDERFAPAGVLAPKQKADLAFTMHMLSWLSPKGTAAIVEFPGILDRANEKGEPGIRKYLVENNFIDSIILMPKNLFYGTTIDVCILVLKKNKTDNSILFVNASNEFVKATNNNKLSDENISNILDLLRQRKSVEHKSILVPYEEIDKEKYNLSVNYYLEPKEEKKELNIEEIEKKICYINSEIEEKEKKLNDIVSEFNKKGKKYNIKYKTVEEVCDTLTDYVAAGSFGDIAKNVKYLSEPDFAQLIRTTDIKNNFKNEKAIYISESAFNYLWRVNLDKESIVLPNIGNCGEVYYITPDMLPYKNNALATNAILLRSSTENMKYLKYAFECDFFQKQLKKITSQQGQTKFNKTNLKKLIIPIPEINVQNEIVSILDELEKLEAILETNYKMKIELVCNRYYFYKSKMFEMGELSE